MKRLCRLFFPKNLIREPLVYRMAKECGVTFDIRETKIMADGGTLLLALDGAEDSLGRAAEWLKAKGVRVEAAE